MVEKITIRLPLELLKLSGLSSERLIEKNLLIWALELYSDGMITVSKAANLVNMKIDEFLNEFKKRHLLHVGGPSSLEDVQEEYKIIQNLIEKK